MTELPAGPLSGVRILDLTSVILGPYATQILADFGADVIKVEAPSGDIMRHVGPMRNSGMGHIYLNLNRNKRSIVLDLKQTEARDALRKLASACGELVCARKALAWRTSGPAALGLFWISFCVRASASGIFFSARSSSSSCSNAG